MFFKNKHHSQTQKSCPILPQIDDNIAIATATTICITAIGYDNNKT
jgi:hypothetical protein